MIKKNVIAGTAQLRVIFGIPSTTWADQVSLVGEFNEWDTAATPPIRTRADAD